MPFGLLYFVPLILLLTTHSFCQEPKALPNVQVLYLKSNGQDVYFNGQQIGVEVRVLFSGKYEIYNEYFKREPVLIRVGYLEKEQLDSLKSNFRTAKFCDFPKFLPRTIKIFAPADKCLIGFRKTKKDSMKIVKAILLQKRKHYPKSFFKLKSKLDSLFFPK